MRDEIYGTRDLSYSAWHRAASIKRFVGWERAQLLSMCDADCILFLEYDPFGKEPLCLIETAIDVGQNHKPATAITRLAKRAKLPAYLVLYQRSASLNPGDLRWRDVRQFRIRRLWPRPGAQWRTLSPKEWAEGLLKIRPWSARQLDAEAANDDQYLPRPVQATLFGAKEP